MPYSNLKLSSGTNSEPSEGNDEPVISIKAKRSLLLKEADLARVTCRLSTGNIIRYTDVFSNIVGTEPYDEGNLFSFFANTDDIKDVKQLLSKNLPVSQREIQLVRPSNGQLVWVNLTAVPSASSDVFNVILRDISQQQENLAELQRVNQELDNFVYHSSHDLRSPLRSILGLVQILKLDSDPKERNKCLDLIEDSVDRLDVIVTEMLSLSRNRNINDPIQSINTMVEINNAIEHFYTEYKDQGLFFKTDIRQAVPFFSDMARVRIIINNLISNAIKFKDPQKDAPIVSIAVRCTAQQFTLIVKDNGIGIPEDKHESIFEMFVRVNERSGSGLGLYTVKHVIEKLEGTINVQSAVGEGTTITVELPNELLNLAPQIK